MYADRPLAAENPAGTERLRGRPRLRAGKTPHPRGIFPIDRRRRITQLLGPRGSTPLPRTTGAANQPKGTLRSNVGSATRRGLLALKGSA